MDRHHISLPKHTFARFIHGLSVEYIILDREILIPVALHMGDIGTHLKSKGNQLIIWPCGYTPTIYGNYSHDFKEQARDALQHLLISLPYSIPYLEGKYITVIGKGQKICILDPSIPIIVSTIPSLVEKCKLDINAVIYRNSIIYKDPSLHTLPSVIKVKMQGNDISICERDHPYTEGIFLIWGSGMEIDRDILWRYSYTIFTISPILSLYDIYISFP